jgi:hypothetical protein
MALFKRAESTSAYLKAGLLGFAGSGKTFTATQIAIGLANIINERKLKEAGRPIFFLDTETGSDYVTPAIRQAGLEIFTAKTRAYVDLIEAIDECEKNGSVLIIDSITHFWREFVESYQRRKNVNRLDFQDWNFIKGSEGWGKFSDRYVNSSAHIIMCGRAGYEYDTETNDRGKKEQVKSGIKMKSESESGFEPSLLILMERETDVKTNKVKRTGYVLKERFNVIDGREFANPTFASFMPHIELLNLGGAQMGVDNTRNSDAMFASDGDDNKWRYEAKQKDIALEEIKEEINKHVGYGQDQETKKGKAELLEKIAGTRAWAKIEAMKLPEVRMVRDALWVITHGHPYGGTPAAAAIDADAEIPHEPKEKAA